MPQLKMRTSNSYKSTLNFETNLNLSKIQSKNMVSFIILQGATMNIFGISEHV